MSTKYKTTQDVQGPTCLLSTVRSRAPQQEVPLLLASYTSGEAVHFDRLDKADADAFSLLELWVQLVRFLGLVWFGTSRRDRGCGVTKSSRHDCLLVRTDCCGA